MGSSRLVSDISTTILIDDSGQRALEPSSDKTVGTLQTRKRARKRDPGHLRHASLRAHFSQQGHEALTAEMESSMSSAHAESGVDEALRPASCAVLSIRFRACRIEWWVCQVGVGGPRVRLSLGSQAYPDSQQEYRVKEHEQAAIVTLWHALFFIHHPLTRPRDGWNR